MAITLTLLVMIPWISSFFDISTTLERKLFIITVIIGILGVVSALDDLDTIGKIPFSVPPWLRLIVQIGIGLIIGITSIKISYISGFFGGVIRLDEYFFQIEILSRIYTIYYIPLMLTTIWYVLVFNSVNFSDGIP
jgi:UDP-N-acetylmuramyl pentapeptide phosphotransferase/UDP-N-acetylglucosamine-1-phosphate transferase